MFISLSLSRGDLITSAQQQEAQQGLSHPTDNFLQRQSLRERGNHGGRGGDTEIIPLGGNEATRSRCRVTITHMSAHTSRERGREEGWRVREDEREHERGERGMGERSRRRLQGGKDSVRVLPICFNLFHFILLRRI